MIRNKYESNFKGILKLDLLTSSNLRTYEGPEETQKILQMFVKNAIIACFTIGQSQLQSGNILGVQKQLAFS